MSTFNGIIEEFPGVRVDRFEDQDAIIYFLSHIHSDHMIGLNKDVFQDYLIEKNLFLYSSEVSTCMLRQWFPKCSNQFRYLNLNVPTSMTTSNNCDFTVTLLSAGHCPGSVMFLFENDHDRILYTGDFRVKIEEFQKFRGLYHTNGQLKRITKLHMDTTFMLQRYKKFPTRQESCDALCNVIAEWIEISPKHFITLIFPYSYGGEIFYLEIFRRFQMPVHVSNKTYECYKFFPNMDKCITLAQDGQIYTERARNAATSRSSEDRQYERKIRLTAQIWADWCEGRSIVAKDNEQFFRICYSTHASLEELEDVLEFLKPDVVEANVVPQNITDDREEILYRINEYNMRRNVNGKYSKVESQTLSNDRTLDGNNSEGKSSDSDEDEEHIKLMAVQKHVMKLHKEVDSGIDLSILE